MPVSPEYRAWIQDELGRVVSSLRDRSMFGGVGIYAGDLFFALLDDDVLYFKVDDTNRPDFLARGSSPFRPYGPDGAAMDYFEVPADVLEDADELRAWAAKAIAVASRRRGARKRKPRGR